MNSVTSDEVSGVHRYHPSTFLSPLMVVCHQTKWEDVCKYEKELGMIGLSVHVTHVGGSHFLILRSFLILNFGVVLCP